ncbi:hypothetical protein BSL78_24855 [Apostichopus japonicus]|uniref:ZU5 domain-containing protein n=1 Tax=Stichopus japonicus TaxID=307972 RepID=A0A2G8JRA8_STIJA|nr:hypothetical protein BSL78_24855 [Apostichopus japonicus]
MSNNGVGIGPVSSKGDSVSKRRRGPYRKWTAQITQDVSRLECEQQEIRTPSKKKTSLADPVLSCSIESPDDNFASGNIHSMDDVGEATEERDVQPDNFQDYSPQKDEDLDDLINELHANAKENHFGELAEDTYDPITVLGNDIMQIAEDEVEECSSHSEKEVDPPLYPGSKRRLGTIVLLLTCFMIRFKLSQETIHYFLVLLQLILPDRNCLMGTYHGLKKYLAKYTFLPVVHYYCSNCYHHIPKSAKMCSNELCKIDVTVSGAVSYFVQISLLHQLQVLFNRKEFSQQVRNHRFHHLKTTTHNCIRDVYDSKLYQDLYQAGFLNNPNNLSFAMNTDGVAIFKSSKLSMWPVYMIVNELPISERKARENMLMYGIWISPKKPIMWSFLNPLFLDLRKLESGVRLTDFSGEEFLCKAALLSCTCDLPAKSLVTNSIQFNGKHGCWHCLQPGETYRTESGGNCHVFPFNTEDPVGPKRTMEQILKDVKETVSKIKNQDKAYVTNGCKGPFWFLYLKYFNFADGMVIDYMHCVCEGVMKLLLKLWFGVENRNNKFSFYSCKVSTDYGRLMVNVADDLTLDSTLKLATLFGLPPAETDMLRRVSLIETPGITLINFMKTRNIINLYDVTNLQKGLVHIQLNRTNENLLAPYQSKVDPFQFEENQAPVLLAWPVENVKSFPDDETTPSQGSDEREETKEDHDHISQETEQKHIFRIVPFIDGILDAKDDVLITVCFCKDSDEEFKLLLEDHQSKLSLGNYSTFQVTRTLNDGRDCASYIDLMMSSPGDSYHLTKEESTKHVDIDHLCAASRVSHQFRLNRNKDGDTDMVDVKLTVSQNEKNQTALILQSKVKNILLSPESQKFFQGTASSMLTLYFVAKSNLEGEAGYKTRIYAQDKGLKLQSCMQVVGSKLNRFIVCTNRGIAHQRFPYLHKYEQLRGDIAKLLDKQHCQKLGVYFELKPAENETIQTAAESGKMLMKILDERELIMPDRMIGMYEGLKAIHFNKVARLVLEYIGTSQEKNGKEKEGEKDDKKMVKFPEKQEILSKREPKLSVNFKILIEEGFKRLDVQRALKLSHGKLDLGRRLLLLAKEEHERLPLFPGSNLYKEQYIDQRGGEMVIAGVILRVPAGALHTGRIVSLWVSTDPAVKGPISSKSLRLTPFVKFGPESLTLHKPVTLIIPHCALTTTNQMGIDVYSGVLQTDKSVKWSLERKHLGCSMNSQHFAVEAEKPCLIGLHVPFIPMSLKRVCVLPIVNRVLNRGSIDNYLWFHNDDSLEHKSLINEEIYQQKGYIIHDPVFVQLNSMTSTLHVSTNSSTSQCNPSKVDVAMEILWLKNRHKVEFHLQNEGIKDTVNLEIEAKYGLLRRNLFQLSIQLQIENLRHTDQITSPFQLVLPESIIKSFDQLKQHLSVHLDVDQSTMLANIFQLPEEGITDIKKHKTPGTLLLEKLTKNLLISPTNITKLENALTEQGNENCAKLVREFRSKNHVVEATMCPE